MMLKPHLNQQQSTECNTQKEMGSFQSRLLYSFLPNETWAVTHHSKLAAINKRVVTLHHPINILGPLKSFCYYVQRLLLCLCEWDGLAVYCLQVYLPQTCELLCPWPVFSSPPVTFSAVQIEPRELLVITSISDGDGAQLFPLSAHFWKDTLSNLLTRQRARRSFRMLSRLIWEDKNLDN